MSARICLSHDTFFVFYYCILDSIILIEHIQDARNGLCKLRSTVSNVVTMIVIPYLIHDLN